MKRFFNSGFIGLLHVLMASSQLFGQNCLADSGKVYGENARKFHFGWFGSDIAGTIRWGMLSASVPEKDIIGVILLLNGRTEFMEKYNGVATILSSMGYNVLSMDWRGQGLSSRDIPERHKGYVADFAYYLNDLDRFYSDIVAGMGLPVTIMAHSMGGHIALRFLMEKAHNNKIPHQIKKAILLSPMTDICTSPVPRRLADTIASIAVKAGLKTSYFPGNHDYSREKVKFKDNPLTHDHDNFFIEHDEIEKNRELALGGVTWGWLKAAFDSIKYLDSPVELSAINIPVWIASAELDSVVCNSSHKKICESLPMCRIVTIPGANHEILFERKDIQEKFWNVVPLDNQVDF
ncbi:putative lysophospholipase L2 (Lecithinase B) [Desulfamplus magnetovallimortis]|uniref:Putative lysophospholipase L2 (Lecithinase B) n=1 Tax=Desulfamplus magnetovallimortis TaxID=1246637 RepID=A0A1W1HC65_9BACT|nr:alpha/beta hydrolase [Desulfamplus magnetovallimortis]SLM30033.1 putative lysophospholipase L2 (Lecithinase B) [Desulfamplus magnetovallimortis]